jgi:hypothetical protein
MPVKGTKLYTWQLEQLSTGAASLNAKIRKELAENKGSIWSERRVKLSNCVEQKRDGPKALINIAQQTIMRSNIVPENNYTTH